MANLPGLLLEKMSNQRKTPSALSEWLDVNGPRALSFFLVLAPPLAASSLVTDAFYSASDLAVILHLSLKLLDTLESI